MTYRKITGSRFLAGDDWMIDLSAIAWEINCGPLHLFAIHDGDEIGPTQARIG